ncbi:MAG: Elongation factor [Chloroflexota bacterium]
MIDVNDLRKGVTFIYDGGLYRVLEYAHNKPGRGNATIRVKIRNLRTGSTMERTFTSGDRVQNVRLDNRKVQYLYREGDLYYFMDLDTFEQPVMNGKTLGDALPYLLENLQVDLTEFEGEALGVELPVTVDMLVVEAEMAVRGDTATGVTKSVKTSTGLQVQVPAFVSSGDTIRVDTRTGEYLTRV